MNPAMQSQLNSFANLIPNYEGRKSPKTNHGRVAKLISAFLEGATIAQAAEEAGVTRPVTKRFVESLREEHIMYVSSYELKGASYVPVYAIGTKRDARTVKRMTGAERSKRYRERKKLQFQELTRQLEMERAK